MVTGIDFENFAMFKFYWIFFIIYNSGNETILYLINCCWSRLIARSKQKIDSKANWRFWGNYCKEFFAFCVWRISGKFWWCNSWFLGFYEEKSEKLMKIANIDGKIFASSERHEEFQWNFQERYDTW